MSRIFDPLWLQRCAGGQWFSRPKSDIEQFCFDTRLLKPHACFLAIKTEHNDGHEYLSRARDLGAVAAIVERVHSEIDLAQLQVPNTLQAFQNIAQHYRENLTTQLIAITGSCGKTSAKEFLSLLLGKNTGKTPHNYNNNLGLPYSLLGVDEDCSRAVIEVGIGAPNEMEPLAKILQPDIAVILNVGPVHIANFNNQVEAIIREKLQLLKYTRNYAFLHESLKPYLAYLPEGRVFWLSENLYQAQEQTFGWRIHFPEGDFDFPCCVGQKALYTFASMIYIALKLGEKPDVLRQRIALWKPFEQRGEWREVAGVHYFVDCYNANPLSFGESIYQFLREAPQEESYVWVLGSMAELGSASSYYHRQIGSQIKVRERDQFLLIGEGAEDFKIGLLSAGAKETQIHVFQKTELARDFLDQQQPKYVFLKGSACYRLNIFL